MRIGVDGSKIPHEAEDSAVRILERAHALGMEGVYFRSVMDVSPTLDRGLLAEVRSCADELGLYLQMGLAKVNPYAASEAPQVRRLGDGDYTRGMVRMIEAAHEAAGVTELWVACANYQRGMPGYYVFDRFRTDAPWPDQLVAIEKFLRLLAPVARDHGVHLNIETHEEITSYEVVRLVESVGPDVLGVTFDTANVVVRGEDPVAAARRVAPYTRATHLRDFVLGEQDGVFGRVFAPIGQGSIDWDTVLTSVRKTQHAIVVAEAPVYASLSSEIAARIAEKCFYELEAPVLRVCGFSTPYPTSRIEEDYLPDLDRILDAVDRSLAF